MRPTSLVIETKRFSPTLIPLTSTVKEVARKHSDLVGVLTGAWPNGSHVQNSKLFLVSLIHLGERFAESNP